MKNKKTTKKTTKSMSEELVNAYEALDNLRANMRALGVDISTNPTLVELDDALENIKHPKKLSAREQVIHDMDADYDKIENTQDLMLYIIKHTAKSYKFNVVRPYGHGALSSDYDSALLADFQFCVSALEHAANPKLIKDAAIIIIDYMNSSCSTKLNAAMMKAILEHCKVRVIDLLSEINPATLNVGTEQDIIDFKARVGIAD